MLVSVIVPTFNRAHIITRAIASVQRQTHKQVELIIVDDGSTDDTESVIKSFAHQYQPIKYIQKANGGCASARNKGLELASGELLAFLDSDDEWVPTALETLVSKLVEADAELVYSPSIEVDVDGIERIGFAVAAGEPALLAKKHFMQTKVRNGAYMFTRRAFARVGNLDESLRYNEDSDYFQRLSICCKATYSPSPTVRVYDHADSKSRNRTEIYRALLKSSQNFLVNHPDFALELGADAGNRIQQIMRQLVESLVLAGDFAEANLYASDILMNLRLTVRIGIRYQNNILLKLEYIMHEYFHIFKKPFRKAYHRVLGYIAHKA